MRTLRKMIFCCCVVFAACWILPQYTQAASNMQVSTSMVDILKTMEGFSAQPYWDYAQWTVGYGTKCPEDKREYYATYGISEGEAVELLEQELDSFEASVNNFADTYSLSWEQHQFDALVSFSYNCGTSWMSEMAGYFNTAVRSGDVSNDFIYAICLFSAAGEDYVLTERRLCEAYMYIEGGYKASNDTSTALPSRYRYVYLEGDGGKVRYTTCGYDANTPVPIDVAFSKIPTGVDSNGNPFVYELVGWYTQDGRKVEQLDDSLQNGQVLYARWKAPSGNIARLPVGEPVNNLTVVVTAERLNVRYGPGTFSPIISAMSKDTSVEVTEVLETSYYTWGKTRYGWISLDYTNYREIAGSLDTFPKDGSVTGTYVNYRTSPSLSNSTVVGQKGLGDRVTITEETYADGLSWGKMTDGNWICLDYVRYDEDVPPVVTGVSLLKAPTKNWYPSVHETLKLEGSILQVNYSDGSTSALTLTREMVTGFEETIDGVGTVTATYSGNTISFTVKVGTFTVAFTNWDGSVLSSKEYTYGETVQIPTAPSKAGDRTYHYVFSGWDKPVTSCTADVVYTAVFASEYVEYTVAFLNQDGTQVSSRTYHYGETVAVPDTPQAPTGLSPVYKFQGWSPEVSLTCQGNAVYTAIFAVSISRGDVNEDGLVSDADALYLLRHVLFSDKYPINQNGDMNGDGVVTDADALYLLRHTLFAERYPLS